MAEHCTVVCLACSSFILLVLFLSSTDSLQRISFAISRHFAVASHIHLSRQACGAHLTILGCT